MTIDNARQRRSKFWSGCQRSPCTSSQSDASYHSTYRSPRVPPNSGYAAGPRGVQSRRVATLAPTSRSARATAGAIRVVIGPGSVLIARAGSGQLRRTGSSDLATPGFPIVEGFLTWRNGRGSVSPSIRCKSPGRWHQKWSWGESNPRPSEGVEAGQRLVSCSEVFFE